eukprot:6183077-Pleurochrysis_carterae.AAC.1
MVERLSGVTAPLRRCGSPAKAVTATLSPSLAPSPPFALGYQMQGMTVHALSASAVTARRTIRFDDTAWAGMGLRWQPASVSLPRSFNVLCGLKLACINCSLSCQTQPIWVHKLASAVMGLFDGLPRGWGSAKDPQGTVYYFNRAAGAVTYERPEKPPKTDRLSRGKEKAQRQAAA